MPSHSNQFENSAKVTVRPQEQLLIEALGDLDPFPLVGFVPPKVTANSP